MTPRPTPRLRTNNTTQNIATNAGARLGKATNARLGVFQITSSTGNEDYSYGGTFNTSSKDKKGSITVRVEYRIK